MVKSCKGSAWLRVTEVSIDIYDLEVEVLKIFADIGGDVSGSFTHQIL
jgi:hypothetical protein